MERRGEGSFQRTIESPVGFDRSYCERTSKQFDPLLILKDVYGLLKELQIQSLVTYKSTLDSFQVPYPNRIIIEEVLVEVATYMITSCRGRGSNTAFGYFMAGLAQSGIAVLELSFDEKWIIFQDKSID